MTVVRSTDSSLSTNVVDSYQATIVLFIIVSTIILLLCHQLMASVGMNGVHTTVCKALSLNNSML